MMILTHRLSDDHIRQLHRLYQGEWWTKDRTLEETRKGVEGSSLVFGICETSSDQLVGFARVLTDWIFKATIYDVIVDESHRNKGVGVSLMDAIVSHRRLQPVKHLELYCVPEKQGFYRKWGFTTEVSNCSLMRKVSDAGPTAAASG